MQSIALLAGIAAATLVSAQGYNNTHANTTKPYDARTISVPAPTHPRTTALTSIYTITSSCGTIQIYLPSTRVIPLSANGDTTRGTATYTGSSTGAASVPTVVAGVGIAGFAAAMML